MKKIYLALIALASLGSIPSAAQTYSISPNDTVIVTAPYFTITIFDIYQDNISGAPLNLGWTLIENNLVPGWDFSLCDYNTCYVGLPASGTMATVPASGQGFLGLNVDPTNISGTGTVRIYVYDVTDPNGGDTLTWIVSTPTGIEGIGVVPQLELFPNPVADKLIVRETTANGQSLGISVTDVSGREVSVAVTKQFDIYTVDVSSLPAGNYILICRNEESWAQRQFVKIED